MSSRKLVVAGLIARDDGAILITQRREDQALPLYWEFPGGKVELGESPAAALARELREEIDVGVCVGRIWDVVYHAYPGFEVVMLAYGCTISEGTPAPREVKALAWVHAAELGAYPILPADEPLVRRLAAEGPPRAPAS
jgi:8-oxo-dGTP diphosphatase